jgi:hypothetical protein
MKERVTCLICGKKLKIISKDHLNTHNISKDEYIKLYPNAEIVSELLRYTRSNCRKGIKRPEHSLRMMGINNPSFGIKKSDEEKELMSKNRTGKGIGVAGKYERTEDIKFKISVGVCDAYVEKRIISCLPGYGYYYSTKMKLENIYRSSWELIVMKYLDIHPAITYWAHEPFYIEYITPDNKRRNYIPDFLIHIDDVIKELWEVKPQYCIDGKGNNYDLSEDIRCKIESAKKMIDSGEIQEFRIISDEEMEIINNIDWKKLYDYYGEEYDERIL